jgi:hypothetical protein
MTGPRSVSRCRSCSCIPLRCHLTRHRGFLYFLGATSGPGWQNTQLTNAARDRSLGTATQPLDRAQLGDHRSSSPTRCPDRRQEARRVQGRSENREARVIPYGNQADFVGPGHTQPDGVRHDPA